MSCAKELLLEYLAVFRVPEKAASLFAPDGVLELPYLASLNMPTRLTGPVAIVKYIAGLMAMMPDLAFSNPVIRMESEFQVFAEYEVHTVAVHTSRPFHQLYFGWLMCDEERKIKVLREALNTIEVVRALLREGFN
ncbi:nuclear transport factor 2 family protein [Dinghuibacter silviterrae]|uniref:Ketosteroid isomerase-like protein n=1 Tax=Dinghuibacter silviterrae TaxID=1539049 RepID=A0A4R8DFJ7_9BACT|nr:nuclear transport factor 2 family protein [Dinghuibacter silviterrae]TDW96361.1 hypothetical protein EDB95_4189 [Dinghuibacter silviterrae]